MRGQDEEAKERILKAAISLVEEGTDPDKVTVRQLAELAGVGIGLINYHFGSKNMLMSIAITQAMARMAVDYSGGIALSPRDKLKNMLKGLHRLGERYEKLVQFHIIHGFASGEMGAVLYLIPVLREIYGGARDEIELRIIAMQILLPLQAASIDTSKFFSYSGIDLRDSAQRDRFIDRLIDNILIA